MIRKSIENRIDGFNFAIIDKYFPNGMCICTLQQIEFVTDKDGNAVLDEEGKQVEKLIKSDSNIGIDNLTFTDEELAELNPSQEASEII